MSGGHWDYIDFRIEEIATELNPKRSQSEKEFGELLMELKNVFHDAEYYYSGDYSLKQFEDTWKLFKSKWLKDNAENTKSEVNSQQDKIEPSRSLPDSNSSLICAENKTRSADTEIQNEINKDYEEQ